MHQSSFRSPRSKQNVFVYDSRMLQPSSTETFPSAVVSDTGIVRKHKLVHQRSADGSLENNAVYTGSDADCIRGAVYRMSHRDCVVLDRYESRGLGHTRTEVEVMVGKNSVPAFMWVQAVADPSDSAGTADRVAQYQERE